MKLGQEDGCFPFGIALLLGYSELAELEFRYWCAAVKLSESMHSHFRVHNPFPFSSDQGA
jgi:hypothetical protein